ncbi:MAG: PD-(D/E)XK nuclease family protein [Lachnospiraceae bacterium]|nr:PD-(D/E)XK nuclease family protein [Lachnospiraceae bacterium]
MFKVICGRSGSGKTEYIYDQIISAMKENMKRLSAGQKPVRIYLITPEQNTFSCERELCRRALSASHGGGLLFTEVKSFLRLSYRIDDRMGISQKERIDETGKSILIQDIMKKHRDELGAFGINCDRPGYVSEMKSFISELMQYCITPDEGMEAMLKCSYGRRSLNSRLKAVAVVYREFKNELDSRSRITLDECLKTTAQRLSFRDEEGSFAPCDIIDGAYYFLDGFTGFTPLEYIFLESLSERASGMTIAINGDSHGIADEDGLFSMSCRTLDKLNEMSDRLWPGSTADVRFLDKDLRHSDAPDLKALESSIFRVPQSSFPGKPDNIEIYEAHDMEDEAAHIVHGIRTILASDTSGKLRFSDFAVISGDPENFYLKTKDVFMDNGIPVFADSRKDIDVNNYLRFITSLLDLFIYDFNRNSVMNFARNPLTRRFLGLDMGKSDTYSVDPVDAVDNFILAKGIRGSKRMLYDPVDLRGFNNSDAIEEFFAGFRRIIKPFLNLLSGHPADYDERVLPKAFKGRSDPMTINAALVDFLNEIGACETLSEVAESLRNEGNDEAAAEYSQVFKAAGHIFDSIKNVFEGESQTMILSDYRDLIAACLSECRIGILPPSTDSVVIGDLSRTRLDHVKYLYFADMCDSYFPQKNGGSTVISDAERCILKEKGIELAPTANENILREQLYMYMAMTKPERKLSVLFTDTGDDDKAAFPAYPVYELMRIFPDLKVSYALENDPDTIVGADAGLSYFASHLYYHKNSIMDTIYSSFADRDRKDSWIKLYSLPELEKRLELSIKKFPEAGRLVLPDGYSEKIFGKKDERSFSTTELQEYFDCPFRHFLDYGLDLSERDERQLENSDIGNIIHKILERYTYYMLKDGKNWADIGPDEMKDRARLSADEVLNSYNEGILKETGELKHRGNLIKNKALETIILISDCMKNSSFRTEAAEYRFDSGNDAFIQGRIDRIDSIEDDDGLYLNIIDYKTGNTEFSFPDIYYGKNLQLALYMSRLMQYRQKLTEKKVIPAGLYYFNINPKEFSDIAPEQFSRKKKEYEDGLHGSSEDAGDMALDPEFKKKMDAVIFQNDISSKKIIDGITNSEEKLLNYTDRLLGIYRMSRYYNLAINKDGGLSKNSRAEDTKNINNMLHHSEKKAKELNTGIYSGDISIRPNMDMNSGGETSCRYCPYGGICRFTKDEEGGYRRLEKKDKGSILEEMAMEEAPVDEGQQADKKHIAGEGQ